MLEALLFILAAGLTSAPTSQPVAAPVSTGVADVTVAVTRMGPEGGAPAAGVPVTLQALGTASDTPLKEWFGVADPQGNSVILGVSVLQGARYVASAITDGVPYDSRPVTLQPGLPATLPVTAYPTGGDDSAIRVARVFTRVALWEAQLEVHQAWTIINAGQTTYDPSKGSRTGEQGVLIRLPEGAEGGQVNDLPDDKYSVAGTKVLYTGWIRPGPEGAVEVRVSFGLGYDKGVFPFSQPSAYPIDELMTIVPEVPTVRHRQIDGVRLSVGAHNHGALESATERGSAVWVLSGQPSGQEVRFEVGGLPHYDSRPAWAALVASMAIIVWGLARILGRGGPAPGPAPARSVPLAAQAAADLRERRERLMDKLVGLEQDNRGGGLSEDDFRRRRDAIKRRLIDVDRRLDGATS